MSREPTGPKDAKALRQAILARGDGFPKRMAQIARYVVAHPEVVALGSVVSIARAALVAPSSLVRFGQTLGLTGFAELQQAFRNELLERATVGGGLHPAATRYRHILRRVVDLHKEALDTLVESLSEERLSQFIEVVGRAETIFIVAEGRSYPIGVALRYMLGERHVRSCLATRDESATGDILCFAGPDDAVIAIDIRSSAGGVQSNVQARVLGRVPPTSTAPSGDECWLPIAAIEGVESAAMSLCQALATCIVEARFMSP